MRNSTDPKNELEPAARPRGSRRVLLGRPREDHNGHWNPLIGPVGGDLNQLLCHKSWRLLVPYRFAAISSPMRPGLGGGPRKRYSRGAAPRSSRRPGSGSSSSPRCGQAAKRTWQTNIIMIMKRCRRRRRWRRFVGRRISLMRPQSLSRGVGGSRAGLLAPLPARLEIGRPVSRRWR